MRKFICFGILAPLAVLCFMNAACGGYVGWPGKSTEGTDAKLAGNELSVSGGTGPFALENGLWTYYVNYDNTKGQNMKEVSTYRDATAPPGVFTSDGNSQQFFNDHVGVKVAAAYDGNGDGIIDLTDYSLTDAFCPVFVGFAGDPDKSDNFAAYCDKGLWEVIVSSTVASESKQTAPGSKFSNSHGFGGSDFTPLTIARALASGTATSDGGIRLTVTGVSANGATATLTSPFTANVYGFGGISIDISQPGMKEAAAWIADQVAASPSGPTAVTLVLGGGSASLTVHVPGGALAAVPLRTYAGS